MKSRLNKFLSRAKILTALVTSLCLGACTFIHSNFTEVCNSRAHVRMVLADYLSRRYASHSPVRLAIIPFSVPANLTSLSHNQPGLENELAARIHQYMLADGTLPIAEVFNRQDWPAKKDEFFTGNYGALAMAREANYDLVLVGLVDTMRSIDTMTAHAKLIEVESGITLWYATNTASSKRSNLDSIADSLWINEREPNRLYTDRIIDKLADCVVDSLVSEKPVP